MFWGAPMAQMQNVQRCGMQNFYENRVVGYNVVYEFAGRQYAVQMPNDPGPTLQLQVTPVGMSNPTNAPTTYQQPVYNQPATVIVAPPAYRGYNNRPYYPPVGVELNFGDGDGYQGRRHWR